MKSRDFKSWSCGLLMAGLLSGAALADGPATMPSRSDEATKLKMPLPAEPAAEKPPEFAPSAQRPLMPRLAIKPATRPVAPFAKVSDPPSAATRPPVLRMSSQGVAGAPRFEPGTRHIPAPATPIVVRIPNLLTSPRKAALAVNPLGSPATAVRSPTVNNLDGTEKLGLLPAFVRPLDVEVVTPPRVLPFDADPLLQVPDAPDDLDAPSRDTKNPAPPKMEK